MCNKIIASVLTVLLALLFSVNCVGISSSAEATVLMIAGSNEIVFSENPDLPLSMASTTKIMTALIALEYGDLSKEITATEEMVNVEGTSMGLLPGDSVSLEELIYGMLLQSGNDAANAAALTVSGNASDFLELMNAKAVEIGMLNTHFASVSGLDADGHYSTAYDMALLTSYALQNEEFVKICSSYTKTVSYGNPPYNRRLTNHNKLLRLYDGAIGVKTGFTKKSGRCLVSAAQRNGLTLICVTLKDSDDWNNHQKLLDYGFSVVKSIKIDNTEEYGIPVGGADCVAVSAEPYFEPYAYSVSGVCNVEKRVEVMPSLFAPVKKGDVIGSISYYYENGNLITAVPLIASQSIDCNTVENSYKKLTLFEWIKKLFKGE